MITIDNQKQCTKCKEWKPATNEFFGKKKADLLGLRPQCKICDSGDNYKWRSENPERAKELKRKWKEENLGQMKEFNCKYYEANKERIKENSRKWREANSERCKESSRKWYEANPERHKENCRKWREANSERAKKNSLKWREENLEHARVTNRKWQQENPEKLSAHRQQRRALIATADGTSTAEQIKARFQYHENRCYYCGDNESGLHVEHRIPLSRGGSNWPSNLVPACPSCNWSKNTKTEKEFLKS